MFVRKEAVRKVRIALLGGKWGPLFLPTLFVNVTVSFFFFGSFLHNNTHPTFFFVRAVAALAVLTSIVLVQIGSIAEQSFFFLQVCF